MKELTKYAIILVRVSTTIQDFEPQIKDLENYAKSKGYNVFHRIETKETGLADLKDKQGFEELKSFIKGNPQYNTIFATEMSRLGRRQSILHQIKEWLISNKIQLYLKDTTYSLYDENGLISAAGEVMFTLFGYFAESEMKTKKERFKRAKTLLNAQGFSISGKRLFGYDREMDLEVKKNRYVINKIEAEEIRNIFNWYAYGFEHKNEETSISSIVLECKKLNFSKYTHSKRNMNKLLKEDGYTGSKITNNKRKNPNYIEGENEDKYLTTSSILVYPQIVSDELFLKVQERMRLKNTNVDKSTKHITILAKILTCKECRRYFTAQYRFDNDGRSRSAYRCSYTRGVKSCENEKSISMRLIDSTIWSFIKSDISTLWNYIINYQRNENDYDDQIKNLENLIQENLNNLSRLNKRFQTMVYLNEEQEHQSQLEYIKTANKIRSETTQYENTINKINEEKIRSEKRINDKYFEKVLTELSDIEGNKNRIREIINLFVDEIILIHQDIRYSVIKVKLRDNITSHIDNHSTLNYYTTIIIDKRETNNIKLVKALNLVEYQENQLYVNGVKLEIGEAFKLKLSSEDKLVKQIKNKSPYDFLFKKIEYIKLSFYQKGDSIINVIEE
jgi:DNA invertase Pin-like site-specific DNA recombinase